ncbi:MAG TPA: hypothetical protein VMZ28_06470 [Kofleriaceae bacterium]|nr:hypothetical protein [Kofleriaceae bacterium]
MRRKILGLVAWSALAGCSGHGVTPAPGATPAPRATPAPAATRTDCVGDDRRLHGTTCCTVHASAPEDRSPGEVYLDCEGPQVGAACARESDCDIACSCDSSDAPLRPGDGPQGPADGTLGVKGTCTGQRQRGVWMCQLDAKGAVTHLIVD